MSPAMMGYQAPMTVSSPHGHPHTGYGNGYGSAGLQHQQGAQAGVPSPSPVKKAVYNGGARGMSNAPAPSPRKAAGLTPQRPPASPKVATSLPADPDGHFSFRSGDGMELSHEAPHGRYTIVKLLGAGVYGKVVECGDAKYNGCHVAVKVVRNQPAYRAAALREIRVLRHLHGKAGTVQMLRHFEHRGHVCISMELCGRNLKEVLADGRSYSLKDVQSMGQQILGAVKHMHGCGIIHTDIKTDNILLMSDAKDGTPRVKVADLGSATYRNEWHPDLIGTKEYRAPEAVLQIGWHDAADIWSIGCVLFELYAGKMLFEFEEEEAYLHLVELTLGKPLPALMIKKAWEKRNQHNAKFLKLTKQGHITLTRPIRADLKKIDEFDGCSQSLDAQMPDGFFRQLLRGMLEPHPGQRFAPKACLESPFFKETFETTDDLGSSMGESTDSGGSSALEEEEIVYHGHDNNQEISSVSSQKQNANARTYTDKLSPEHIDL
eukprot:CAMPEP_0184322100 /NCGR_PEP_ID=MMETSP1049-20130417/122841_1 /TAXON_ID=77928 /ORGANISM="Proteomonas sulcata, Strain CCMP704" /LENGTH=490 /DNA_ID=CAMNT_0026643123 /DNA_START=486 /DNA_END=1958 /DNA_ORIENTATION=-